MILNEMLSLRRNGRGSKRRGLRKEAAPHQKGVVGGSPGNHAKLMPGVNLGRGTGKELSLY